MSQEQEPSSAQLDRNLVVKRHRGKVDWPSFMVGFAMGCAVMALSAIVTVMLTKGG